MSFKKLNRIEIWNDYCSKHFDLLKELDLNDWVLHTENNFREFVTYGFVDSTKEAKYSFENLSSKQYERLFYFITSYFDMDMQYFTNFNRKV